MTSRQRVIAALEFKSPDRVPRNLWRLPGVKMCRKDELQKLLIEFPEDMIIPDISFGRGNKESGTRFKRGEVGTDAWGCKWLVAEDGVVGEVKEPPLTDLRNVNSFAPPYEILENADFKQIDRIRAETDKFVLAWTTVRPFERMQFLLGTESLLLELASVSNDLLSLRDMIHTFFMEEIKLWCDTDADGISFMDDWGTQKSLIISPELWRKIFKPLYKDYCNLIISSGKYIFFHSDGFIEPIYTDLIQIGIHALNTQLFCMNIEELGSRYRGKVAFWGEIDRQHILPFGTVREVEDAVRKIKDSLWTPDGGVIAQCEFGIRDPVENIRAVFNTWNSIM
jgi:hypothetical protein